MTLPQNPAGPYEPEENYSVQRRSELLAIIEQAPQTLREAVAGLSEAQLDTLYKNWSIRQIVHHIADSHVNCYIRFKWTLTEDHPTIKAYNETHWSALEDSRTGDIAPTLVLFDGLHRRWLQLMRSMTDEQWQRKFHHQESDKDVSLAAALPQYAWHCRHHTGQIAWLRRQEGW